MNALEILIYTILIFSFILFIFIVIYNKIKNYILKANFIECEIDENLREKYDLIKKIKNLNKNDDEPEENDEELSSFDFERKLAEMEMELTAIKDKEYDSLIYKLGNINLKISSNKSYFNETISKYNNLISKFPTRILAKILRYKEKNYFDDKNMYDENKKDFKI